MLMPIQSIADQGIQVRWSYIWRSSGNFGVSERMSISLQLDPVGRLNASQRHSSCCSGSRACSCRGHFCAMGVHGVYTQVSFLIPNPQRQV